MYLFLDTEFVPAAEGRMPILLSIGICTLARAEFYAEVHPVALPNPLDQFLTDQVLPKLARGIGYRAPAASVASLLVTWLDGMGEPTLDVCYDFSTDFNLFEELLRLAPKPTATALRPTHVGYLLGDRDGAEAAESCWSALEAERHLRRHHALADAYALMARFEQVHGH